MLRIDYNLLHSVGDFSGLFSILAILDKAALNILVGRHMHTFFLGIYVGVELISHRFMSI